MTSRRDGMKSRRDGMPSRRDESFAGSRADVSRQPAMVRARGQTYSSAWARSSMRSSMCSVPMDRRTEAGVMCCWRSSSGVICEWVVV